MDPQLAFLFALTFLIHLVGTLAYSVRIAGTRTGRIAVSFALFNVLVLISRTSNSFQAPLLARRVEGNLLSGSMVGRIGDFRWLLAAAALATIVGALLTPTFQRLFSRAVASFSMHRSIFRLLLHGFSKAGVAQFRESVRVPSTKNLAQLGMRAGVPIRVITLNAVAVSIWSVGVFSALYAGYLHPELRLTAGNLSAVVNGLATILLFVVIDPHLSVVTDDVVEGKVSEGVLRRTVVWMVGSRLAGTVLAQALLIPGALLIGAVATWL